MHPANGFPFDEATSFIRSALHATGPIVGLPMTGGASTRKFARFRFGADQTLVAIYVPHANQSDELEKTTDLPERWPFLEVRDLLESRGIRVPRLLHEACDRGLLFVEDLGDVTLAVALERAPSQKTLLYQQAVRDLAQAQLALSELPEGSVVRRRSFDFELLRWEIDHFREWALEARELRLSEQERRVYDCAADWIAANIASWPKCFVHRDYQSRNLMVRTKPDGQPAISWIDFQDALLGPRVYDLVALLGDSYQRFETTFIQDRLDEYASICGLDASEHQQLAYEFDLVTVQRKLKDAGRFVFIDRNKGDPSFLSFVEPTIDKVISALSRLRHHPELAELEAVLRWRLGR